MLALLAALLLGGPAADPESPRGLATVAVLQGTLDVTPAPAMPLKVGDAIDPGTTIKTAAASFATLDFADGCELRLNENTEVVLEGPRKVELKSGRAFFKIVKSGPKFEIKTQHVPITADQTLVDVTFVPRVPNGAPAATTIKVVEGIATTTTPKFRANISAGFYNTAIGSQLNTPDPMKNGALDTAWVNALLAARGRADEETGNRAMELVQVLGRESANDPAEAGLRLLGDLATSELVRMLTRQAFGPNPARRVAAAKIVAETGTLKSAPGLQTLLSNPEADTRVIAARGLARLAGKDLGFNDAYWKGENLEKGQQAWEAWVKANPAK